MSQTINLTLKPRMITGRKVNSLRKKGIIPGNIFGKNIDSQAIQVSHADFDKVFEKAGETSVITVTLEGEKKDRPVLIKNIHLHPVTGNMLHVDFQQVDLTQKIATMVPVEITGESPAVEEKAGILFTVTSEVEIEALPNDIPESIKVDISSLKEYNDTISVKDLKAGLKYTFLTDQDTVIVQVQEQKEEKPELEPVEVEGESESEAEATDTKDSPEGESNQNASETEPKKAE